MRAVTFDKKFMETMRESSYIHPVNRRTRTAILHLVTLFLAASPALADLSAFLIVAEGAPLADRVRAVEALGVRVRQRVPPRILVVDVPSGLRISSLPGIDTAYASVVPVSSLDAFGPAAVAAGLQWNRQVLSTAKTSGVGFSSLRFQMSDRSLSPPDLLNVSAAYGRLACEWTGIDGAVYYEIQAARSADFGSNVVRSHSVRPQVEIPVPVGEGDIHVRVRGIDPVNAGPDDDVFGRWTNSVVMGGATEPVEDGSAAPTLTSPANNLMTQGFTLVLEWSPDEKMARVQMARDANFTNVVYDEVVKGGEYACPGPALQSGDRLYWRVQTWDTARSAWSATRQVRIGEPKSERHDAFVNPEAPK